MADKTAKCDYARDGAQGALRFFSAIVSAGIVSLAMLAALAFAAVKLGMSDGALGVLVNAVYALGVTICGILSARRAAHGGMLRGALSGVVYAVLLYLAGCAVSGGFGFSSAVPTGVCTALICGGIGGIIGINMKKR